LSRSRRHPRWPRLHLRLPPKRLPPDIDTGRPLGKFLPLVASAAWGARCVSTALAGSAVLAESCTALESLPASDKLLDPPACAPADTMTIAATKIILRI
jgi:hypothetical protein